MTSRPTSVALILLGVYIISLFQLICSRHCSWSLVLLLQFSPPFQYDLGASGKTTSLAVVYFPIKKSWGLNLFPYLLCFALLCIHLIKFLSMAFQATVNRSKGNRTEISKAELIQKSSYCRVSGTTIMTMLNIVANSNWKFIDGVLDALQIVIWIFWNCRPMAMYGVDQILGGVESNEQ